MIAFLGLWKILYSYKREFELSIKWHRLANKKKFKTLRPPQKKLSRSQNSRKCSINKRNNRTAKSWKKSSGFVIYRAKAITEIPKYFILFSKFFLKKNLYWISVLGDVRYCYYKQITFKKSFSVPGTLLSSCIIYKCTKVPVIA